MRSLNINSMRFTSINLQIVTGLYTSLFFCLFLFTSVAQADSLVMQPSELKLSATKPVANLLLRNDSTEEQTILIDIKAWQQDGGRNVLMPTGKLLVLPETVRLQPGESSEVRVALKLSGPLWDELAFQLQLTEVPRIPDVGSTKTHLVEHRLTHQSTVPVFLLPPGVVSPRISWNVARNPEGTVNLTASNGGRAHVQLHSASLAGPDGQRIEMSNLSTIILPGGSRSWALMEDATGGLWQLTANTNAGLMQAELELGPNFTSSHSLTLSE